MCLAAAGRAAARGVPLLAAEVYSRMSKSLGQLDRTCSMICMALARGCKKSVMAWAVHSVAAMRPAPRCSSWLRYTSCFHEQGGVSLQLAHQACCHQASQHWPQQQAGEPLAAWQPALLGCHGGSRNTPAHWRQLCKVRGLVQPRQQLDVWRLRLILSQQRHLKHARQGSVLQHSNEQQLPSPQAGKGTSLECQHCVGWMLRAHPT